MKIVSTSEWGSNPRYINGAIRQYELTKEFYPNWTFRIYTDDKSKYNKAMPDAEIIEIKDNSHGVFWRFLPLFESEDNIVIVRDADGRITLREQMAVQEWLESNNSFHIFRDHEAHYEFPIIACAFGLKGKLPEDLKDIMSKFMYNTNYYTNDQVYLRDYIFPYVESDTMIHSMKEGWFGETRLKLKNKYSFCGNGYDEFDMPLYPASMEEFNGFDQKNLPESAKFDKGIMSNMTAYFITPVHNKENLIEQVIDGIYRSVSEQMPYEIIFIIDGCTDGTEAILKKYIAENSLEDDVTLLYQNDVHEITSLNTGLEYIRDNCNPTPEDLVFTVQDDVILKEDNIDLIFKNLFEAYTDLGYISCRLGCNLHSSGSSISEYNFVESEFGHWKKLGAGAPPYTEVKYNEFVIAEAVIRSPTCVQWKRYVEVGFYNMDLAPCGFDCHDMSIRMNIHGYKNGVYALKYESDVDWGSTRTKSETKVNSRISEIYERNKAYVARTYKQYFESK